MRDFIARDNQSAAASFIKDLTNKLKELADVGITGSPRDWVSAGLRGFPYKGRCFYFRIINEKMVVVRILHGKQDVTAQSFF